MPKELHRESAGHFADRLIHRLRTVDHPLCVGLDPHLDRLPPLFRDGTMSPLDPRTPAAVESFLCAVLDRLASRIAIVKPQVAFFERLGWRGLEVLENVVRGARERGLLVLLDAKRGDIGSTASAYAEAYLGKAAALPVDAITLNPYLGLDTLEPFLETAKEEGRGLFVLVKTSNRGAGDFQDRLLAGGEEKPLFESVAEALRPRAEDWRGPRSGFSSLGVVVGATWPGESERIRKLLPSALFLVPGYGAQGASARDALAGFLPGANGRLEGGLVNSSRGILFPAGSEVDRAAPWERAIDRALERSIDELREASLVARPG